MNREIILPYNGFDPREIPVYLDNISFNMEVIAYYSEIRFYKTFWYGTYGHILGDTSSREIDLIYKVKLYGSASDNCITTGEISGITTKRITAQIPPAIGTITVKKRTAVITATKMVHTVIFSA